MDTISYDNVYRVMGEIFADLSEDLDEDVGSLSHGTRLVDLGLESISLVYLISELQQHFGLEDQLFRKLRQDGLLLKNMSVGDIVTTVVGLDAATSA